MFDFITKSRPWTFRVLLVVLAVEAFLGSSMLFAFMVGVLVGQELNHWINYKQSRNTIK